MIPGQALRILHDEVVSVVMDRRTAFEAAEQRVWDLINELEPDLDRRQARLLHELRLAAETVGALRVTTGRDSGYLGAPSARVSILP